MPSLPRLAPLALCVALHAQDEPVLAGRVLSPTGEPAPAELILRWRVRPELPGLVGSNLGDRGLAEERHRAGDDGRFRIALPHRGPFLLLARHGGLQSEQAFPLMAGDYRDLVLEPVPAIGGAVFSPDGEPVGGACVVLFPERQTWARLASYRLPERRGECVTDDAGRFSLRWELGYLRRPQWGAFVVPWVQAEGVSLVRQPLLLRPTEGAADLRIALEKERRLTGRIVDGRNEALAGARLVHRPGFLDPASTDAQGRFDVSDPGPGQWWLETPDTVPCMLVSTAEQPIVAETGATLRFRLRNRDGAPLPNARVLWSLQVARSPPIEWLDRTDGEGRVATDRSGRSLLLLGFVEVEGTFVRFHAGREHVDTEVPPIEVRADRSVSGQVLGIDRAPLPHARVALLPDRHDDDHPARVTYADRGGRFAFDAVAPGAHRVMADAGGEGLAWAPAGPDADEVVLRVTEGVTVQGTVVDERGEPVPGAWITLTRGRKREEPWIFGATPGLVSPCTFTDADGRFTFRGLPEGGPWTAISNYLRGGGWGGGGAEASGHGETGLVVRTRELTR